ncbi:GL19514 [Drosophila persimilis]|uniref:Mitochondrial import inner membrane translocase subunit n=1 Tax=Drosophila persimilis TaxID=7234 RepID=B4G9N6_DROPE|nr:GL19514 [Drosophila persimilis]
MSDYEHEIEAMETKRNVQVCAYIHEFREICWKKCDEQGTATEKCLSDCMDRFMETITFVSEHIADALDKQGAADLM